MSTHPYSRIFIKTSNPGASDDSAHGYEVGDIWIRVGLRSYQCIDDTVGGATWNLIPDQSLIDTTIASAGAFIYASSAFDASGSPNYPSANRGNVLYVSVAGKIGGASGKSVDVGDLVVCLQTSASGNEATVGAYWFVLEHDLGDKLNALVTGWTLVTEAWTRTGNHTFTVSGDLTVTYRKGMKVRYKDGGSYEYGTIYSSSYSSPNTTVTLFTNSDYAMAAATITDTYLSPAEAPEGFPQTFNYAVTWTGSSSNPAIGNGTLEGTFKVVGDLGSSTRPQAPRSISCEITRPIQSVITCP